MLQTYSSVTLDPLPGGEGDNAELLNFKAAMVFCIAAGSWMSCDIKQEHIHVTLAACHLISPE